MDRVCSGPMAPLPHDTGLTCMQYALVLLPGLITGRLCDLGYFKRTMLISRSARGILLYIMTII